MFLTILLIVSLAFTVISATSGLWMIKDYLKHRSDYQAAWQRIREARQN